MVEALIFPVPPELDGIRADKAVSLLVSDLTRSRVQQLFEQGEIQINGKTAAKSSKIKEGDRISVTVPKPEKYEAEAENIPLDIVYEDEYLLVVNKPKGMVVHPAAGNESGTLVNALLYHCGDSLSGINGVMRPGIVHRIDKDTSGLLIVAKNDFAHQRLALQIKEHSFTREYTAVAYGKFKEMSGTVNAPIGRHPVQRKKMAVTEKNSKEAVTHYEVLEEFREFTHLRLILETGRTHQIRVHMSYLGHPLAGDPVYGPKKVIAALGGQCLHAGKIGFVHPKSGEYIEFTCPPPESFLGFLEKLRRSN